MGWDGYFELDGNEIINVTRTETYAHNARMAWFKPQYKNDSLPFMLGDGLKYQTPLLDDAPWLDPDAPASLGFYGFYPLDVSGLEDSTRTSTVVESLADGGIPGRLRNATKTVVFNGILVAESEASAEYGMRWLKQALLGGPCGPSAGSTCGGGDLCYLSSEPEMELPDANDDGTPGSLDGGYFLPGVVTEEIIFDGGHPQDSSGSELDGGDPEVTYLLEYEGGSPSYSGAEATTGFIEVQTDLPDMDGGGAAALPNLQFDGGAANSTVGIVSTFNYPFDYGVNHDPEFSPDNCLDPYLRSLRKVVVNAGPSLTSKRNISDGGAVWTVQFTAVAGSPYEVGAEVPVIEGFMDPTIDVPWVGGIEPEGGLIDLDGYIHDEKACAAPDYAPIYDPLFPALIPPPGPPTVPMSNYTPPLNWQRRQFTIPKSYVPLWGEVVPKMSVHARTVDLRNLRLRFYSDPFEVGDISDDPCAYCGDIVISYLPKDHTLTVDGSDQTVYVTSPGGQRRRADSLVFRTDGAPFEWPALSCGAGFIVTLDLPQTQLPPVVDLSLFPRAV